MAGVGDGGWQTGELLRNTELDCVALGIVLV